jgi:dihydroorotase (multifunctional complex type)
MQSYVIPDIKIIQPYGMTEGGIAVADGKIVKIGRPASLPNFPRLKFPHGSIAFPGLIDAHVHLRDMDLSYKEDFATGTRAAARGGYTTVLDMPNTQPPTDSPDKLREKMEHARGRISVNVGFFGALSSSTADTAEMASMGVVGFKLYMSRPISPLPIDDDQALARVLNEVARQGSITAVHAEDRMYVESSQARLQGTGKNSIGDFLAAHHRDAELNAVSRILRIGQQTGSQMHICHVSLPESVRLILQKKREGFRCTCEATPHHLLLSVRNLLRKKGVALMVPPLRPRSAQTSLWKQLAANEVDIVASDHAPHTLDEKMRPSAWEITPGIPGLETTLPLLLTEFSRRGIGYEKLAVLASTKPAEIFRLASKGQLVEGYDADITIVDPKARTRIEPSQFESKAKYSPFEGVVCRGKASATIVRGQLVMNHDQLLDDQAGTVLIPSKVPG